MDGQQYRDFGKAMIDYTAEYHETIRSRSVVSAVEPGYLRKLLPASAPEEPESWETIMKDVDKHIMPGVTHWQHPNFYAYFPTAHSHAATVADILSDSIACMGFSWASCPVYTELEVVVLDWLVEILGLPEKFLSHGKGGGVINSTASEVTLTMMYAARNRIIEAKKKEIPDVDKYQLNGRLVGYCSEQAHSSVERAGLIALIRMRAIPTNPDHSMNAEALEAAVMEDMEKGFVPFFVCSTLGSTNSCAFDDLSAIGPVCKKYDLWLHVDAAYGGSFFICPEFRHYLKGVEFTDSFNFNGHKGLLINFDCSIVWISDRRHLVNAFEVNPVYLQNEYEGKMPEYRHWHLALGRRFRSLKIWFVLRLYGVKALQKILRNKIERAKEFKDLIVTDGRFEIVDEVRINLICFRLKNNNEKTQELLQMIRNDGRIHLVPGEFEGVFFLRLVICYQQTTTDDVKFAYSVIKELCDRISTT